jgi:hypothetical protein
MVIYCNQSYVNVGLSLKRSYHICDIYIFISVSLYLPSYPSACGGVR